MGNTVNLQYGTRGQDILGEDRWEYCEYCNNLALYTYSRGEEQYTLLLTDSQEQALFDNFYPNVFRDMGRSELS
jgi:hypothetical protein